MKRSFREPKNRYKNGAKNARRKIATLKSAQSLKNKGNFPQKSIPKKTDIANDTSQIRLAEGSKDD